MKILKMVEWQQKVKWIILVFIAVLVFSESGCREAGQIFTNTTNITTETATLITVSQPEDSTKITTPQYTLTPTRISLNINHNCTNINLIPRERITQAKTEIKVLYLHTSHGNQVSIGMNKLQEIDHLYNFNETGSDGALLYREIWTDLGTNGDTTWVDTTNKALNDPVNIDINVVMWSWCSGMSANTEIGVSAYLEAMSDLEKRYPKITFVYMTGHLDGTGISGNLNERNNQVRQWCNKNNKVLFDFADIESYDPDNNYFLDKGADADCSYDGGNWAEAWVQNHPNQEIGGTGYFEHTHVLNCNLKGRAFWWMISNIAGSQAK